MWWASLAAGRHRAGCLEVHTALPTPVPLPPSGPPNVPPSRQITHSLLSSAPAKSLTCSLPPSPFCPAAPRATTREASPQSIYLLPHSPPSLVSLLPPPGLPRGGRVWAVVQQPSGPRGRSGRSSLRQRQRGGAVLAAAGRRRWRQRGRGGSEEAEDRGGLRQFRRLVTPAPPFEGCCGGTVVPGARPPPAVPSPAALTARLLLLTLAGSCASLFLYKYGGHPT